MTQRRTETTRHRLEGGSPGSPRSLSVRLTRERWGEVELVCLGVVERDEAGYGTAEQREELAKSESSEGDGGWREGGGGY